MNKSIKLADNICYKVCMHTYAQTYTNLLKLLNLKLLSCYSDDTKVSR